MNKVTTKTKGRIIELPRSVIEQLVERDTPKKVILDTERVKETYLCPNCKKAECTIYNDFGDDWQLNYCDNCGQRLDWGELKVNKYEDALLTMKLVKRDYKNDGFEQDYLDKVIDLLKQAEKQEKLLELYIDLGNKIEVLDNIYGYGIFEFDEIKNINEKIRELDWELENVYKNK